MRVVEYEKVTHSISYRTTFVLGIIGAFFSIVICALIIANNLSLKSSDPIHSKGLEQRVGFGEWFGNAF